MDSNREEFPKGNKITLTSNVESLIDSSVINPDNYSNELIRFVLKFYRSKDHEKLIISHFNINSIRVNLRS